MDDVFQAAMERLLNDHCPAALLREADAGTRMPAPPLWQRVADDGFLDMLVPQERGGAGLGLAEACPTLLAIGRHHPPVPLVQTLLARAALAPWGEPPAGRIAIAGSPAVAAGDALSLPRVAFGASADWVLAEVAGRVALLDASRARIDADPADGRVLADMHWPARAGEELVPLDPDELRRLAALASCCLMAGLSLRVFEITLEYAGTRSQFGKPIARFQAIQQQLAVMAELVDAACMSAQLACQAGGPAPCALRVAAAKAVAGGIAPRLADAAHAVHGAMGITWEYDLQLYSRPLRAWRLEAGGEGYWAQRLGRALLDGADASILAFLSGPLGRVPGGQDGAPA